MSEPQTIEIPSGGETLSALLYLPEGAGPHPAVVLGGGWCYVKEIVQPIYASVFARSGIAALIFDYRYMGASTGEPRQHIDPWQQIEDYRNAISYLESRDDIDDERIGAWGISYSGGHVLILGALDARVRAVCRRRADRRRLAEHAPRARDARLPRACRPALPRPGASSTRPASTLTSRTSPTNWVPSASWPFPKSRVTFAQLKASGRPAYEGRATAASTEMLLAYSVCRSSRACARTPTLMVVAEGDDHTHWDLAAEAFDAIPGERKRLHVVPRSGHLTMYEDEAAVAVVAQAAADWFAEYL